MKRMTLVVVLAALAYPALGVDMAGQDVAVTADLTFVSKYIWRGFDVLDDTAAWQPSVDLDFGNGFGFNVWASLPGSGGTTNTGFSRVDLEEWNYTLYYSGTAMDSCWQTDYTVGWRFYDYPDVGSDDADMQELFVEFAMPNLTGTPLVPHGAIYQMWPSEGGGGVRDIAGTIYVAGFSYGWTFDQMPELPMTFSWDIVYNDGTGGSVLSPVSADVDSDWSHMVWGLKTQMECPMTGATVTPAVYYQNSFEDSVNTEDEFWAGLSYTFSF